MMGPMHSPKLVVLRSFQKTYRRLRKELGRGRAAMLADPTDALPIAAAEARLKAFLEGKPV